MRFLRVEKSFWSLEKARNSTPFHKFVEMAEEKHLFIKDMPINTFETCRMITISFPVVLSSISGEAFANGSKYGRTIPSLNNWIHIQKNVLLSFYNCRRYFFFSQGHRFFSNLRINNQMLSNCLSCYIFCAQVGQISKWSFILFTKGVSKEENFPFTYVFSFMKLKIRKTCF